MYYPTVQRKKGRSLKPRPLLKLGKVLDLVFAFGAGSGMFHTALGLGFFHCFLRFLGPFGTGFGALLPLFVQHLFAAQQFDEGIVGTVALAPARANDAQVAAITVPEARADGVEKLVHGGTGHQVRERLTARVEVTALAEGN